MSIFRMDRRGLAVGLLASALALVATVTKAQDAPGAGLDGTWKLVVLTFGEDDFAVVKLNAKGGNPAGQVVAAQDRLFGNASALKLDPVTIEGDSVSFTLMGPGGASSFQGKLAKDGPGAGKVLGSFAFRGDVHPARLERTDEQKVGELKQGKLVESYVAILRDSDPKSKVKKALEAIERNPGNPTSHLFYSALMESAEAAGLGADKVTEVFDRWTKDAELYGNRWAEAVRAKAIKALSASKNYAQLTANLTQRALSALPPTAAAELEAPLVATLARSARLAGLTEIADKAQARSAELEGRLDEEYHKKVPPFTPSKFAGRKNAQADRVVVMELFTGAQCPPCVAADVGYDALLTTYGPKEFIGLQYHLHIPGPDPMTNDASEGRQKYYGEEVGGTPATFFNGQSKAGGGGPMQASENKYTEFRQIIDAELEKPKESAIKLTAALHGDQIEINAEATVDRKSPIAKPDDAVTDEKEARKEATKTKDAPHSKPRLRLALTEESVRYVGGNRLRFHHHVVRAFPGGVDGKDLSPGSGRVDLKVSVADLKRELEQKNSADAKSRPFPSAPPEPALKKLSVVAFVQDDADKAILHAVSVPVE